MSEEKNEEEAQKAALMEAKVMEAKEAFNQMLKIRAEALAAYEELMKLKKEKIQ